MKALDCETLGLLVHPYVDGELVGEDKEAVETHVQRCARCGAALAREQELLGSCARRARFTGRPRACARLSGACWRRPLPAPGNPGPPS
jgi:anti-sigma factor RsiW